MIKLIDTTTQQVIYQTDNVFNTLQFQWTLNNTPQLYVDIPHEIQLPTTMLEVLWVFDGIVFRGIVMSHTVNSLSHKLVLECIHHFYKASFDDVPINYSVKGQTISDVLTDSNVVDTSFTYLSDGTINETVEYLFSKQTKLQAFNELITGQTTTSFWRTPMMYEPVIQYGAFGQNTGILLHYGAESDKTVSIINHSIEYKNTDFYNQVEVVGGSTGNGMSVATLRDYTNGNLTPIAGYPVTIEPVANTDSIYLGTPDRIRMAPNNQYSFIVSNTASVLAHGVRKATLTYQDLYPIAEGGVQVSTDDILAIEKKLYDRAIRFLRANDKKTVYSITTGKLPIHLQPGDKVRVRIKQVSKEQMDCVDDQTILLDIDTDLFITRITKKWDTNYEINELVLCDRQIDYRSLTNTELELANRLAETEKIQRSSQIQRKSTTFPIDGLSYTSFGNFNTPANIIIKLDIDLVYMLSWTARLRFRNPTFIDTNTGGLVYVPAPTNIIIRVDGYDLSPFFMAQFPSGYPNGFGLFPGAGVDDEFDILKAANLHSSVCFDTISSARVHTIEISCSTGSFEVDWLNYIQYSSLQR